MNGRAIAVEQPGGGDDESAVRDRADPRAAAGRARQRSGKRRRSVVVGPLAADDGEQIGRRAGNFVGRQRRRRQPDVAGRGDAVRKSRIARVARIGAQAPLVGAPAQNQVGRPQGIDGAGQRDERKARHQGKFDLNRFFHCPFRPLGPVDEFRQNNAFFSPLYCLSGDSKSAGCSISRIREPV